MRIPVFALLLLLACGNASPEKTPRAIVASYSSTNTDPQSWTGFLQHLPVVNKPILDYQGRVIGSQEKHVGIIPYDVGKADLQQCADALMRLRAEYLFAQQKFDEIGFHFVGGQFYTWRDYCKGLRPVPSGNDIRWTHGSVQSKDHASLRAYLDIVYMYASTISLARELKPAADFAIGTVIIHPGSPGHCSIIIDERSDAAGHRSFRLAEGYTPAQSIYVLRNPNGSANDPWQTLSKGPIITASYTFTDYQLGKFE
jgi:hypothetical protein